MALEESFTYM